MRTSPIGRREANSNPLAARLRIDQQEMRRGEHAIAAVQPKQVARLDHQRADLVVSAAIALQLVEQFVPAAAPSMANWMRLPCTCKLGGW